MRTLRYTAFLLLAAASFASVPASAATDANTDRFLKQFDASILAGDYADAQEIAEKALEPGAPEISIDLVAEAYEIAVALQQREAAMREAANTFIGREVTIATTIAEQTGKVSAVSEGFITVRKDMVVKGKLLGTSKVRIKWSDLTLQQADDLASKGKWKVGASAGKVARVYLALQKKHTGLASKLAAKIVGGELVAHLRPRHEVAPTRAIASPEATVAEVEPTGDDLLTTTAIKRGLNWLDKNQDPDGSWSSGRHGGSLQESSRIGLTGLVLLSYLGAGHTELKGPHARHIKKGLEFLLTQQSPTGMLGKNTGHGVGGGYNHGIAGLALVRAYARTKNRRIGLAAQRGIACSVSEYQSDKGGWRYSPRSSGDTSVTCWFTMQLYEGRRAGLKVPTSAFHKVKVFLDSVTQPGTGRASYTPGKMPTCTMTAAALSCRYIMGWRANAPLVVSATDYLHQCPPGSGTWKYYYMVHGSRAMSYVGGLKWGEWRNRAIATLLSSQVVDEGAEDVNGSWGPDSDAKRAGRAYSTACAIICLSTCANTRKAD